MQGEKSAYLRSVRGIAINKSNIAYEYLDDYSDCIGHGTILVDVLLEHIAVEVDLFIIKIIDTTLVSDVDLLIKALEYCDENCECDLIQISMGTLYTEKKLQDAVNRLVNKGVLIVSAFDNDACISYPAAYKNVIGVDVTRNYRNIEQYNVMKDNVVDIQGADVFFRVKGLNGKKLIVKGSSFYCSYIVSKIANLNLKNMSKGACIEELQKEAQEVFSVPQKEEIRQLRIRKVVVFPFNKEIHSLAAFEHLLGFEILNYYDFRQKGLVNKKISDVLPYTVNEKRIYDFEQINWDDDFDTFICGHVGEISRILGYDVLEKIFSKCRENAKQLVCFDNITDYMKRYPDLFAWFPTTSRNMVPNYRYGKLRSPNIPIIGVFGTSSRQGKMTIQLLLRDALKKMGIKIKNLGSEPEAVLLGFEYAYVFGYESTDVLAPNEMVQVLNEAIYELEKDDCEMIIVGSQSGTVPHQLRNLNMLPFKQYLFLLGTQPDSIILCVNCFDSEEYIERTIEFFNAVVKARVICLVVSYVQISKKNVIAKPMSFFEDRFKIPVFDLHNLDVKKMIEIMFAYYGEEVEE